MKKEKPITVELARSEYENVQSVELGVPLTALFPRGISFSIDPYGNVEIIDDSASRRIRLSEIDPIECECDSCVTACSYKPGWFAPGEAERAAELLGISLRELFETRLMVDWPTPNPNNQFLLSPAIVGGEPGAEFPVNPRGVCVFLTEGKCGIHGAKPRECRESDHRNTQDETTELHEEIAKQWATPEHQAQIRELLGREPAEAEEWSDELTPIGKLYAEYARLMGE